MLVIDWFLQVHLREIDIDRFGILLECPRVENDNLLIFLDFSSIYELFQAIEAHGRFRAYAKSLRTSDTLHPADNAIFPPRNGGAPTLTNRIQDHKVAYSCGYAKSTRDRAGIGKRLCKSLTAFECLHNRCAPIALAGDQSGHSVRLEPT